MPFPTDYKYTKEDEWVKLDGNIGTVGITDYAQNALGDIVFVELPKPGDKVTAGQTFGSVESVKAVSDLYAPIGGEVVEVNSAVANDVQLLADDPYEKGWLIKLRIDDPSDTADLMDFAAYEKRIADEAH